MNDNVRNVCDIKVGREIRDNAHTLSRSSYVSDKERTKLIVHLFDI